MIKDENQLKQLANSDFGRLILEWLDDRIKQMTDISKIKSYDELLGKQEAVKILKELFVFLDSARQKQPEIQKNDYK